MEITIETLREWAGEPTLADEELQSISFSTDEIMMRVGIPSMLFKECFKARAKEYIRIKSLFNQMEDERLKRIDAECEAMFDRMAEAEQEPETDIYEVCA